MITQSVWELIGVFLCTMGFFIGIRTVNIQSTRAFNDVLLATILITLGAACFIFRS